jgi:hypothetical protein
MTPLQDNAAVPSVPAMVLPANHLTIVKLELSQQAGPRYDVMLRLCRPLTGYESRELAVHRPIGLDVSADDPSQLIASHTTVQEVCDRLPEFQELLSAAVSDADAAQNRATQIEDDLAAEQARRQKLVDDTNIGLGAGAHIHDPVVGAM